MCTDGSEQLDAESVPRRPVSSTRPSEPQVVDTVFDSLNHRRRRAVCRELDAAQEPRTLEDLAFALAARERDPDRGEPTNYQWEKVYAALYHRHIPVLADLDVVEFDAATGTVSRGCAFEQVWDALAAVDCAVGVEMPTDGCSARGGADE